MYEMNRRKLIALLVGISAGIIIILTNKIEVVQGSKELYLFYLNNFLEDTGAGNAVTAIYLNYRLFDTFFETLLLLLSVIGIIYFSTHEGDY